MLGVRLTCCRPLRSGDARTCNAGVAKVCTMLFFLQALKHCWISKRFQGTNTGVYGASDLAPAVLLGDRQDCAARPTVQQVLPIYKITRGNRGKDPRRVEHKQPMALRLVLCVLEMLSPQTVCWVSCISCRDREVVGITVCFAAHRNIGCTALLVRMHAQCG